MSKKKNNKGLKDRLFCFELKQDSFDAKEQKKFKRFASFEVSCAEAATVCELIADYEQAAIHEKYRQRTLKSNHLGEDRTWKQPSLDDQIEACACVLIQSVYRGHKGRQEALEEKHALLGSRREQGGGGECVNSAADVIVIILLLGFIYTYSVLMMLHTSFLLWSHLY